MRGKNHHNAVDTYRDQLHRAGWSLGEIACTNSWTVDATRGGVRILASAPTQAKAWRLAFHRETTHANESRTRR
jgi:hypothetical protein